MILNTKYNIPSQLEVFDILWKNLNDFNQSDFKTAKKFNTNTPVNIYEKSNELKIEILIPGRTKEDIDIDISDDIIHVTSKIKEDDNDYYHKSINKEDVSLSWKVSDKFDLSKTSAKYEGGILELTILLNKEKEKLNKKIKIA